MKSLLIVFASLMASAAFAQANDPVATNPSWPTYPGTPPVVITGKDATVYTCVSKNNRVRVTINYNPAPGTRGYQFQAQPMIVEQLNNGRILSKKDLAVLKLVPSQTQQGSIAGLQFTSNDFSLAISVFGGAAYFGFPADLKIRAQKGRVIQLTCQDKNYTGGWPVPPNTGGTSNPIDPWGQQPQKP